MADTSPDLTALHREAFAAIREALDVPYAALGSGGEHERAVLLQRRADAVWSVALSLESRGGLELVREAVEHFKARIAQLPVTYRPVVREAKPLPVDCMVCGPGCCAPVLGVHTTCPGPLVGRTVESVR